MFDICFLGAGHLGELILKEWLQKKVFGAKKVAVYVRSKKSAAALKKKYKCESFSLEKSEKIPAAKIYLIAVRPGEWATLREKFLPVLQSQKNAYCISIMAGIKASELEKQCGTACLVAMTNTCLQVGKALTTQYASARVKNSQKKYCKKLFENFGPVFELDEDKIFKATVLGGSHPAFILWIINEVAKIVRDEVGIKDSLLWVQQIFAGALALIKKEKDIAHLITQIATPGGCTQEGLNALQNLAFDQKLKDVFSIAEAKATMLAKQ